MLENSEMVQAAMKSRRKIKVLKQQYVTHSNYNEKVSWFLLKLTHIYHNSATVQPKVQECNQFSSLIS